MYMHLCKFECKQCNKYVQRVEIYVYIYVNMCKYMYICIYVYVSKCVYICTHTHLYVCILTSV